jgi:hypothetical protein
MQKKITIQTQRFNDKDFWNHHTERDAVRVFITDSAKWESRGVQFNCKDHSRDRYIRDIEITAQCEDDAVLTEMVLTAHNYGDNTQRG